MADGLGVAVGVAAGVTADVVDVAGVAADVVAVADVVHAHVLFKSRSSEFFERNEFSSDH